MSRVIAFANQRGGVAKTTTTLSIGAALQDRGRDVLLVDLDPQGALTYSLGYDPDGIEETVNDVLLHHLPIEKAVVAGTPDLLPANIDLAGADTVLLTKTGREYALERSLREVANSYDYILIDCPPSLGILTINGLTAASEVLIPLQAEALSHRGVGQLLETIADIKRFTNPTLRVAGLIVTMFDPRTRHAREVLSDVSSRYGIEVLQPPVRKSIRFAEASSLGRPITQFAPSHPGAEAYRQLAALLDGERG
jgi:chromosome partitioning protein